MGKQAKIASMPREIREAVSKLLDSGATTVAVAEHINAIIRDNPAPGFQADVTDQNIARWRDTGHMAAEVLYIKAAYQPGRLSCGSSSGGCSINAQGLA